LHSFFHLFVGWVYTDVNSPLFTIQLNFGGEFKDKPFKHYQGGSTDYIDYIDPDRIYVGDIHEDATKFGCVSIGKCWFKVPNMDLKNGLMPLQRDADVLAMTSYVPNFRVIEVYIENVEGYVPEPETVNDDEAVNVDDMFGDYFTVDISDDMGSGFEDSSDEDFVYKGGVDDDAVDNEEFEDNVDDFDELFDTSVRSNESRKKAKVMKGKSCNMPDPMDEDKEGVESDYANSDELVSIHSSDEEDGGPPMSSRFRTFVPERDMESPDFELGVLFGNAAIFRRAVRQYSILNKKSITFKRNDRWKMEGGVCK